MGYKGKIYIGQVGVLLKVDTQIEGAPPVDWSNASLLQIICKLPDKSEVTFPATLDGTYLNYVTNSSQDLPQPGIYAIQAHVVGPTYDALGETTRFTVYSKWN